MIRRMARPFRGQVHLDDGSSWPERDYISVAGGTIDQIGLDFKPFFRFGERPGAFHLLGIHTTPTGLVRELPRIWRGQPMRAGRAYDATPTSAVIESADGVIGYMIDGDLHECRGELRLSVGPRVRIVVL